jgi:phosphocarrier protein HPr
MSHDSHICRRQVGVGNVLGLHLRVANRFVKLANTFQSEIQVHCKGIIANGKSILGLLSLAAESGTLLALEAKGCDADDAVAALAIFIAGPSLDVECERERSPRRPDETAQAPC